MEQTIQLQFLDLDEVDHSEQDYVKSLLYSVRSPRLHLPWVEPEEIPHQWTQEQYGSVCSAPTACYQVTYHQDGEPEITGLEASIPPTNEIYQVPVPVQTTMPQIFQVVSPMHNLPPYTNMAPPAPSMGFILYSGERTTTRRARSKPSPKRTDRRDAPTYPPTAPTTVQYSPAPYPMHVAMPTTPYQYTHAPPHMPSAQHAAGPPLFIATPPPPIPMFPAAMYPTYTTQVYSPHMPHDEYGKELPAPVEEKIPEPEEPEKPVEKPPSVPINAIRTTAPPTIPVKKQQPPRPPEATTLPASPTTAITPTTPTITQSQSTAAAPQTSPAPPPPPVPDEKPPESGKSWAGLFKEQQPEAAVHPRAGAERKPPMSAVHVNRPRPDAKPQPPAITRPPNPDEDPLLRSLGERLSTYQLEHKALVLTPRGLTNPSNYCYINATLQALLACPAFYNLIKVISQVKDAASGPLPGANHPKTKTPVIDSMVQFIKEFSPAPVNRTGRKEKSFRKDLEELDIPVGPPFEPSYVYKMLHALRNETAFQVEGRQEDAEEFLSLLLNGLNDEMLELVKLTEDPNKDVPVVNGDVTANGESHNEDSSDWKEVSKGVKNGRITRRAEMAKTPLSEIFRGQLRSRLQRADEESTDNVQPFFTLQLDIESSDSVPEALEKYFGGPDLVEGTGGLSSTGSGDMWQQHSLEELPNVLILHLKCFHYRQQSCHKIAKALEFPIDLKIESKFVSNKYKSNSKMRQYKLLAVVYHDGKEASKGHYLADAFHVGSSGWVRYDDSVVRPVTEAVVLKPKPPRVPYLLYYRRADTIGLPSHLPR